MPKVQFGGIALALSLTLAAIAPAHAGLVALYNYDNAANLGLDSSGNGNNLVAAYGTPTSVAGKYGSGLDLNANAALVSTSGTLAGLPTGDSSYTIASWINPDTAGGSNAGGIVGWGNYFTNNQVVAFRMNFNNQLHNYWWANDLTANAPSDLTTGAGSSGWHFVAATYDAATDFNAIYIDGAMVSSRYATGLNAAGTNFAVGKTVNSEFFDGQLDNTAIFNQALSASQLGKIAANDYSEFGVSAKVPEPETLMLMGLGMMGLMASRRRRRQASFH